MSDELFGRKWAVTIMDPDGSAYQYDHLRTVFDINKQEVSTSNKSKIAIYGLNAESRQTFSKKGLQIQLQAGYESTLETLYLGDIMMTTFERHKQEVITTFECGDGERQLVMAHFDRSYPPGTSYGQIVKDLAKALNVNVGTILGVQNKRFNSGSTFSGSVKKIMDDLLRKQSLEWSIQNGVLQILPIKAHTGDEAILISKETGMIGLPSRNISGTIFKSLLNPRLMPGTPVQLISTAIGGISGFFKIRTAHFEGDSHGSRWEVTCEGTPTLATQTLPANRGLDFTVV